MSLLESKRIAVVVLPLLRLQRIQRSHPQWNGAIAAVDSDAHDAPLLELNTEAYRAGLRPQTRLQQARQLVPNLHVGVLPERDFMTLNQEVACGLQTFSPRVENISLLLTAQGRVQKEASPGHFFLDPSGLDGLFGGVDNWAKSVHHYLRARKLRASILVGHHPWRTWAIARNTLGPRVLDLESEKELASELPLHACGIPKELLEGLALLGIHHLSDFMALPRHELHRRFGSIAEQLHHRFSDDYHLPLQPLAHEKKVENELTLDSPTREQEPLLFSLKTLLDSLLATPRERGEVVHALRFEFFLEKYRALSHSGSEQRLSLLSENERHLCERIEPASPEIDSKKLMELVRLRLSHLSLPALVERIRVTLECSKVSHTQRQLHYSDESSMEDRLTSAAEAIAKVRATFGDASVTRAEVRSSHLPEHQFRFCKTTSILAPVTKTEKPRPTLQRRLLQKPLPIGVDARGFPNLASAAGKVVRLFGPHRKQGGWWGKECQETLRDYYFAETESGSLFWLFHDPLKKAWFIHAEVD